MRIEKTTRYLVKSEGEEFDKELDAYIYLAWTRLLDGKRASLGELWGHKIRKLQMRLARYLQWLDFKGY